MNTQRGGLPKLARYRGPGAAPPPPTTPASSAGTYDRGADRSVPAWTPYSGGNPAPRAWEPYAGGAAPVLPQFTGPDAEKPDQWPAPLPQNNPRGPRQPTPPQTPSPYAWTQAGLAAPFVPYGPGMPFMNWQPPGIGASPQMAGATTVPYQGTNSQVSPYFYGAYYPPYNTPSGAYPAFRTPPTSNYKLQRQMGDKGLILPSPGWINAGRETNASQGPVATSQNPPAAPAAPVTGGGGGGSGGGNTTPYDYTGSDGGGYSPYSYSRTTGAASVPPWFFGLVNWRF